MIEEGASPPDFTLKDQEGVSVSLNDFRGRDLILYFYPKDDTPGCIKEACGFRDLWAEIEATGAAVLGVSPDDAESHQAFISKHQLPLRLLCDPGYKMMTQYGAFGEKNMYGRVVQGVIRSTVWVGPDGKVKKHWRRVPSAAAHPRKVLEALRAS